MEPSTDTANPKRTLDETDIGKTPEVTDQEAKKPKPGFEKSALPEEDFLNSLSRKEDLATPSGLSSVYKDTKKELPAWMRSKSQPTEANKYDQYGRRDQKREVNDRYAKYSQGNDRYSKYGASLARGDLRERSERAERERGERNEKDRAERNVRDRVNREPLRPEPEEDTPNIPAPYLAVSAIGGAGQKSDYRTFHSTIAHKENKDINSIVRQHYNQRTFQLKLQGSRTKSPIYKLRNFNNAIKYMLLGNHAHRLLPGAPLIFLDLCCGKGGDLNKCEFIGVDQYIGIDISDASVKEAFHRYSQNKARFIPQNPQAKRSRDSKRYNFESCFATGDLFTYALPEILEPNFPGIMEGLFPVDCVSIQFSFHYAWETESKVRTVLTNITKSLRPGGTFIGTIPSSDFIREKIVKKEFYEDRTFGNDLYHVRFENDPPEDGVFRSPFGNRYDYFLRDAVDDVPEYVVPFEYLRLLCEDFGLILKYKKNFIDIFNLEIPKYFNKLNKNLVEGMKRADGKYGVEGAEKDAVAFYIGFVFEKLGN